MPIAGTAFSIVMLAGLLRAEASHSRRGRYICKPLASAGFLLVCLSGGGAVELWYGPLVFVGLIFGAGGDVALMFEGRRAFLAGLGSFLLGHLAYVVAIAAVVPLEGWLSIGSIGPILGAAVVGAYLWPHLGSMRVPVLMYILVITAMAVGALAATVGGAETRLGSTQAILLTAGALAFFASDVAVARDKFVAPGFVNRAWGLPAYYAGQLLIAWSTVP